MYLVSYVGMSLLLSLWVLPGLVAALTPVPYRALIVARRATRSCMAFMTTSLFAVLPLLTEQAKALVREYAGVDAATATADVIVPASFNFPHTGKLLSLSFVLFAGLVRRHAACSVTEYPRLAGAGLLAMFGNVNAAIPFLLDLFRIPADTFRLFVTSGDRQRAVRHAARGRAHAGGRRARHVRRHRNAHVRRAGSSLRFAVDHASLLTAGVVGGTRVLLQAPLNRPYDKDVLLTSMRMLRDRGTGPRLHGRSRRAAAAAVRHVGARSRADRRGLLRVGYFEDSLPYAFFNNARRAGRLRRRDGAAAGRGSWSHGASSCRSIARSWTRASTPRRATS